LQASGKTGFSFAAIVDLKRARSRAEKRKENGEQARQASHFRAMDAVGDAIRHSKIVGRRQTCDLTRHASDLVKLLSEVKYAPTHKRAF
jgi:hypothetical protein